MKLAGAFFFLLDPRVYTVDDVISQEGQVHIHVHEAVNYKTPFGGGS